MQSMTNFNAGDVVLVVFPFTDWSSVKQRPAVVVSPDRLNRIQRDIILCAITSYGKGMHTQEEYVLDKHEQDAAGLPHTSKVKLDKIITIDSRLIRKRLGRLPENSAARLLEQLRAIFTID